MTNVQHDADTTAICAAINAQFSGGPRAFPPDEIAGKTTTHMAVWVYRTYNDGALIGGESSHDSGRVIVRYICKTWDDLNVSRAKTRTALDEKFVGSRAFKFETEGDVATDEGFWVSDDSFTYTP